MAGYESPNSSNAAATLVQSTRIAKLIDNHPNPVMFLFIRKLSMGTLRWVPLCQGFGHISAFLHHFVLDKLATSSKRAKWKRRQKQLRHQEGQPHNCQLTDFGIVFIITFLCLIEVKPWLARCEWWRKPEYPGEYTAKPQVTIPQTILILQSKQS